MDVCSDLCMFSIPGFNILLRANFLYSAHSKSMKQILKYTAAVQNKSLTCNTNSKFLESNYYVQSESILLHKYEYHDMRELIWVRRLIKEISDGLGIQINKVTDIKATVNEDNQGAISNAEKFSVNNRTRHIHTKYWHFREHLGEAKGIVIQYINSAENIGDIFTKGTKAELYVPLCKKLMGW